MQLSKIKSSRYSELSAQIYLLEVEELKQLLSDVYNAIVLAVHDEEIMILPSPNADFSPESLIDDPLCVENTIVSYLKGMLKHWTDGVVREDSIVGALECILANFKHYPGNPIAKLLDELLQQLKLVYQCTEEILFKINEITIEDSYLTMVLTTKSRRSENYSVGTF